MVNHKSPRPFSERRGGSGPELFLSGARSYQLIQLVFMHCADVSAGVHLNTAFGIQERFL